jgi:hypothetical protein
MRYKKAKEKYNNLLIFNKETLRTLETNENTLNNNIKSWIKTEKLIPLKKGSYIFKEDYQKEKDKDFLLEYISNTLAKPSYLSCEYVLAKYQLLTEAVYGITAITIKNTKEYNNKLASFRYYSIKSNLFIGYKTIYKNNRPIYEATKSKALFDYLYIYFFKNKSISKKAIQEIRVNWELINKKEFKEIYKYAKIAKNKRILKLIELIKEVYDY